MSYPELLKTTLRGNCIKWKIKERIGTSPLGDIATHTHTHTHTPKILEKTNPLELSQFKIHRRPLILGRGANTMYQCIPPRKTEFEPVFPITIAEQNCV